MADIGGRAFLHQKALSYKKAQASDLEAMLASVKVCKCKKCGKPAFDPSTVETNRAGECEACFMAELQKQFDKENAKEKAKVAKMDAKRKLQGYTHKVVAWVHPEEGGDDYQMVMYTAGKPSDDTITKELKKRKSAVLNDFQVTVL